MRGTDTRHFSTVGAHHIKRLSQIHHTNIAEVTTSVREDGRVCRSLGHTAPNRSEAHPLPHATKRSTLARAKTSPGYLACFSTCLATVDNKCSYIVKYVNKSATALACDRFAHVTTTTTTETQYTLGLRVFSNWTASAALHNLAQTDMKQCTAIAVPRRLRTQRLASSIGERSRQQQQSKLNQRIRVHSTTLSLRLGPTIQQAQHEHMCIFQRQLCIKTALFWCVSCICLVISVPISYKDMNKSTHAQQCHAALQILASPTEGHRKI